MTKAAITKRMRPNTMLLRQPFFANSQSIIPASLTRMLTMMRRSANVCNGSKAEIKRGGLSVSLMSALKFLMAHLLGSTLAAVIALTTSSPENASAGVIFFLAATFAMFSALPAMVIGLPALTFLLRSSYQPSFRVCALAAGGAIVGALLMSVTFTSLAQWGAICGASIGTMQGLIFYGREMMSNDQPSS